MASKNSSALQGSRQVISDMDMQLHKQNTFDERAHDQKRAMIMKRAEMAKRQLAGSPPQQRKGSRKRGSHKSVSAADRSQNNRDLEKIQKKYLAYKQV